jgi:hypothetical protein
VVAIGVSTGGPNALARLLQEFPADLPVPVVVVQHMPPIFTKLLADRLDAKLPIRVGEAAGGECLVPGEVWTRSCGLGDRARVYNGVVPSPLVNRARRLQMARSYCTTSVPACV